MTTSTAAPGGPLTAAELPRLVLSLRDRIERDRRQLFWLEGLRGLLNARRFGHRPAGVVWCRKLLPSSAARRQVRAMEADGVPSAHLSPGRFRELAGLPRASGVGLVLRQRWTPLAGVKAADARPLLAVEGVRSAGNLGTMLRTAEAVGAPVACVGPRPDPFAPPAVRASMGGLAAGRVSRCSAAGLRQWADGKGVRVLGLDPAGGLDWRDAAGGGPTAVVVGEERRGLTDAMRAACDALVSLPVRGQADSLNVGVAAGVMLYACLPKGPPDGRTDADGPQSSIL